MQIIPFRPFFSEGTCQQQRLSPYLLPEHIKIDDNELLDDMALAASLSETILYFNNENKPDGDWQPFFKYQPLFALAHIAATPQINSSEIYALIAQLPAIKDDQLFVVNLKQVFDMGYKQARQIDSWYTSFHKNMAGNEFFADLGTSFTQYHLPASIVAFRQLGSFIQRSQTAQEIWLQTDFDFTALEADLWQTGDSNTAQAETIALSLIRALLSSGKVTDALQKLEMANSYLTAAARKSFQKQIAHTASVQPHTAMFITFSHLMSYARELMNDFTKRHLDYYYNTVLQMGKRSAVADAAFISYALNKGIKEKLIPKNTVITGKAADGSRICFSTDDDLPANSGRISSIFNLCFSLPADTLNGPQDTSVPGIFTSVFMRTSAAGKPVETDVQPWKLFGTNPGKGVPPVRAHIGFAVSSPILLLAEGTRTLTMTLWLAPSSDFPVASSTNGETELNEITSDLFLFSITIAGGWLARQPTAAVYDSVANSIVYSFLLSDAESATAAYLQKDHGDFYDTSWPVIKGILNPLYPSFYSFFSQCAVSDITLNAAVTGVRDILLYGDRGKLNGAKPFQPFTSLPQPGSYLVFTGREMLTKYITSVTVTIDWLSLPQNGFYTYYHDYVDHSVTPPFTYPINNSTFKVRVYVLQDGNWVTPPNTSQSVGVPLFASANPQIPNGSLSSVSTFTIGNNDTPTTVLFQPDTHDADQLASYTYPKASNGYYEIVLTDPSYAFGGSIYPSILSGIVMNNTMWAAASASHHKKCKKPKESPTSIQLTLLPLPNAPYTPVIRQMTLDYTAVDSVSGSATGNNTCDITVKRFHISPFSTYEITKAPGAVVSSPQHADVTGLAIPYNSTEAESPYLLPYFRQTGYVYICFADMHPGQSISVLLHLIHANQAVAKTSGALTWEYLSDDLWRAFPAACLPVDETGGFMETGILKITLPDDITTGNSSMPPGYWLRVGTDTPSSAYSSLYAVYPQAVKATRSLLPSCSQTDIGKLAPGTLSTLLPAIPQVAAVEQPLPSYGGRAAETEPDFYLRVSERLRHKQRAITPWDYERIVLQEFPFIFYTRCLSHSVIGNSDAPGNVLVIVVPYHYYPEATGSDVPVLSAPELGRIQAYLSSVASPFVTIAVSNPVYVFVRVRCSAITADPKAASNPVQEWEAQIRTLLMPWQRDGDMDANLDADALTTAIQNSISQTESIRSVTGLQVILSLVANDGSETAVLPDSVPDNPWYVFVPASEQLVTVVAPDHTNPSDNTNPLPPVVNPVPVNTTPVIMPVTAPVNNDPVDPTPVTPIPVTPPVVNPPDPAPAGGGGSDGTFTQAFETAYGITMANEGYYADDKHDRGGETWMGIARHMWGAWPGWLIIDQTHAEHPSDFVSILKNDTALEGMVQQFYQANYWSPLHLDSIADPQLANQLFDTAVNMGPEVAPLLLQLAINDLTPDTVRVDKQMGPLTIAAANAADPALLYNAYRQRRVDDYYGMVTFHPHLKRYLDTWLRRIPPYQMPSGGA